MGLEEIRRMKEQAKLPKERKVYRIPAKSQKKIKQEAEEKERLGGDDTDLVKWFKARMKQMTGYCSETGMRTETKIYSHAVFSICHILEKRDALFPSVKTHPKNWIELAPDIHTLFDKATWQERELMGCWPIVWQRLLEVYPSIDKSELHHLPTELRERIEKTLKQ